MESIGRYRFVRELGHGGMGTVFEAVDPYLERTIAVKVIHLSALAGPDKGEFLRDRLFREARSAGKLDHPNIVTIFDVGQENGIAYIAMELVDGPSLHAVLASEQKLDYSRVLGILKQAAAALDHAHDHGIIHRDVKPANIMLKRGEDVKVVDFGIAKIVETFHHTRATVMAGTPGYMAPEQIQGLGVTDSSDQFSLAVVAFEMLCGVAPFRGDSLPALAHEIVYGPRPSPRSWNPDLPRAVDGVLNRALAQLPENRFSTCSGFAAALSEAMQGRLAAKPTVIKQIAARIQRPKPPAIPSPPPKAVESIRDRKSTAAVPAPVIAVGAVILVSIIGTVLYRALAPLDQTPEHRLSHDPDDSADSATGPQGVPVPARLGAGPKVTSGPPTSAPESVDQPALEAPEILEFRTGASTVTAGESFDLSWNIVGASEIEIDPGVGSGLVSEGRRRLRAPGFSTTYTLTARGKGGESTAQATIIVVDAPKAEPEAPSNPVPAVPLSKDSSRLNPVLGTAMNRYIEKRAAPVYPREAKDAGVEGAVRLTVVIGTNGRVIQATPVSGDPRLQDAARQAVLKYIYRPYKINGKPVEVSTDVLVTFTLK